MKRTDRYFEVTIQCPHCKVSNYLKVLEFPCGRMRGQYWCRVCNGLIGVMYEAAGDYITPIDIYKAAVEPH